MRRPQRFALLTILVLCLGMLGAHLRAYVTDGHAWGTSQVVYYVNPTNIYVPQANAIAAVQNAASNWNTQAGVAVQFVYGGVTGANSLALDHTNNVFFRTDTSGYIAETYWWYDGTGHLVDGDVVFHQNKKFYTGNVGCLKDGYYVENTATHEFGHVLGLAHSAVATATMWATSGMCEVIRETLDPDDIAGVQTLYPPSTTVPPAAPSQLTVSSSVSNPTSSLLLAWTDNTTIADGYRVERSADGVTFAQVAQLGSTATSYVDVNLLSGTWYYYRVSAFNGSGSSGYSNAASGQTQAITQPPSVPVNLSPANGATGISLNGTLTWTACTNAQSYDVYFGTSPAPPFYATVAGTSVPVGSLASGTTYYWRVVAKNSVGSTAGAIWSFTTRANNGKGNGK
jgi:hypothetical protein